jgi:hypothetical protein
MNFNSLFYTILFLSNYGPALASTNEYDYWEVMDEMLESRHRDTTMAFLRHACEAGYFDLLRLLVHRPTRLQEVGGAGALVDWVVAHNYPKALSVVVEALQTPEERQAVFTEACHGGHMALVGMLLADPTVDPAADGQAALIAACKGGHLPVVQRLCEIESVRPTIKEKRRAISFAIKNDRFELLRYMMRGEGPVQFMEPPSRFPVYSAMWNGKLEALVVLMEHDQESHANLTEDMLKGLKIDITRLPPAAVTASTRGDLDALKANVPTPFHSMAEFDVLLGLARHHPALVAFLKKRQFQHLENTLPNLQPIMAVIEGELTLVDLLKDLERKEAYNFLIGKQLQFIAKFIAGISLKRSSDRLNAEQLAMLLRGRLPKGFKQID